MAGSQYGIFRMVLTEPCYCLAMSRPMFVGGTKFRFDRDSNGKLVPANAPLDEHAPEVTVAVDLYMHEGRMFCGEVTLHTTPKAGRDPENLVAAERDEYDHIDSALWRSIPIGFLIEETTQRIQGQVEQLARDIGGEHLENAAAAKMPATTRGRRSPLTDELLTEVAVTYRSAGRRPVVAVRALLDAREDFEGSGPAGEVTIDQARKAVARARALGVLPATKTKRARS